MSTRQKHRFSVRVGGLGLGMAVPMTFASTSIVLTILWVLTAGAASVAVVTSAPVQRRRRRPSLVPDRRPERAAGHAAALHRGEAGFGAGLRRHRHAANLTMEEVASRSGLYPSEISRIEKDARDPRLSTVVRLADALDTTPAQLLGG